MKTALSDDGGGGNPGGRSRTEPPTWIVAADPGMPTFGWSVNRSRTICCTCGLLPLMPIRISSAVANGTDVSRQTNATR
jgi:hypothetical protein